MFGIALGALRDVGVGGLFALAVVTFFVLFTFWVGSLGSSTAR